MGLLAIDHGDVCVAPVVAIPTVVAAKHREGGPELPVAVVLLIAIGGDEAWLFTTDPNCLKNRTSISEYVVEKLGSSRPAEG
jgi:hypothetical protein